MSAEIESVEIYSASCAECNTGSDFHEDEDRALEWAANHDAEQHAEDDRADEAYENYKESRYDKEVD